MTTPSPDLDRWRALVDKTLRGAPFDKKMVRRLPGGLTLPALSVAPPEDAVGREAAAVARVGRWARVARCAGGAQAAAGVARGIDAVWLHGAEGLASVASAVALDETGVLVSGVDDADAVFASLSAAAERQGLEPERLWGGVLLDPTTQALTADVVVEDAHWDAVFDALVARPSPHLSVLSVSSVCATESGASAPVALGLLLASGAEALRQGLRRGHSVGQVCQATRLMVALGPDQLVGTALLRAARVGWARLCAALGESDAQVSRAQLHAVQSQAWLTVRDPWVNLLRATVVGLVGAVGGADAITLAPHDAASAESSELGARLAANLHLLLGEESHLDAVSDPAGGSYAIEHLTSQLVRKGWAWMQQIEAAGGVGSAAGKALVAEAVAADRTALQAAVDRRKVTVVGVSDFPDRVPHTTPAPALPTTGLLPPLRVSAAWEALRDAADAQDAEVEVFLATWGPLPRHSARATWVSNLLGAGGLRAVDPGGLSDVAAMVAAFERSGARCAVICGHDADYPDVVPTLVPALKAAGARVVWLAGRGGAHAEALRAAGVDAFVHVGAPVRPMLQDLHTALSIMPVASNEPVEAK